MLYKCLHQKSLLIIIVILMFAGCTNRHTLPEETVMSNQSEDIAAIKQLSEDWGDGWINGNPNALLALLSDEPALIMSGEDPIIGKEAIRELYESSKPLA